MMKKETGGFAFPSKVQNLTEESQNIYRHDVPPGGFFITGGMTLRDHFAGLAMQSLCSDRGGHNPAQCAEQAYVWADSMIKARGE